MTSISLYCDSQHEREDVARFVHHDALGRGWTLEHPLAGYRRDLVRMVQVLDESGRPSTTIGASAEQVFARRYRLSCQQCHTRVVVRDNLPLWDCLAELTKRGVVELRLAELAAALRFRGK